MQGGRIVQCGQGGKDQKPLRQYDTFETILIIRGSALEPLMLTKEGSQVPRSTISLPPLRIERGPLDRA